LDSTNNGNIVEIVPSREVLTVLLDVLGVLLLELIGDRLVVDERQNILLVIGWVYSVSDNIGTLEQVCFEVVQRERGIVVLFHAEVIGATVGRENDYVQWVVR